MRCFTQQIQSAPKPIIAKVTLFPNQDAAFRALKNDWSSFIENGGSAFVRDIPYLDDGDGGVLPFAYDFTKTKVQIPVSELWYIANAGALQCVDFIVDEIFKTDDVASNTSKIDSQKVISFLREFYEKCPYAYHQIGRGRIIIKSVPRGPQFTKDLLKWGMELNHKYFQTDYTHPEHKRDLTNFIEKQFFVIGLTDRE